MRRPKAVPVFDDADAARAISKPVHQRLAVRAERECLAPIVNAAALREEVLPRHLHEDGRHIRSLARACRPARRHLPPTTDTQFIL